MPGSRLISVEKTEHEQDENESPEEVPDYALEEPEELEEDFEPEEEFLEIPEEPEENENS